MDSNIVLFLAIFVLTISSLYSSSNAITYSATSNASETSKFATQIGLDYSLRAMQKASSFIWATFQQSEPERRHIVSIRLTIEKMEGVAYSSNDIIHFNADYLDKFPGDVRSEFTGILYLEMTHALQWNGNGRASSPLIEGIANYVRLKSGYIPGYWVKPGEGDKWDQGYDVTAHFLDYCDSYRMNGFVARLNKKMKDGYIDTFFMDLLGSSADQLWAEYKAMYNK